MSNLVETKSVHLVATSPLEMAQAQGDLSAWLIAKLAEVDSEVKELKSATEVAIQNKWESKTLAAQLVRARQRHIFYTKTLQAVNAGYCIIPNFPIDIFAVRVTRDKPRHQVESTSLSYSSDPASRLKDEAPDIRAAGIGSYVSPSQLLERWEDPSKKDEKGNETGRKFAKPIAFGDIEFPIIAAQATVMDATSKAMALKLFDRIGICPQGRPLCDPLIIGQILLQKRGYQDHRTVSFIIAWHLDLRTL